MDVAALDALASDAAICGLTLGHAGFYGGLKSRFNYVLWVRVNESPEREHFVHYGFVECGVALGGRIDWAMYTPYGVIRAIGCRKHLEITLNEEVVGRLVSRGGLIKGSRWICSVMMPCGQCVCTILVPFLKEVRCVSTVLSLYKAEAPLSRFLSIWPSTSSVDMDVSVSISDMKWWPSRFVYRPFTAAAVFGGNSDADDPRLTGVHPPTSQSSPLFSDALRICALPSDERLLILTSALIASGL